MIQIASIQIAPIFLDAQKTWKKLASKIVEAKSKDVDLVTWGETLIPGYPQWISTSGLIRPTDFSHLDEIEFPMKGIMEKRTDNWQNGGSMIVDPTGKIVAGPLIDEEGILYADIDPLLAIQERQNLDISGHYSRFDIFNKP